MWNRGLELGAWGTLGQGRAVHLSRLRLRDFRNYGRLDADFAPGFHVLLGRNAQGKTNVLESIYLLATLRSFRGVGGAQMIRHGATGYFVGANVTGAGDHEIKAYWSPKERKLSLDGRPVRKLGEYLGTLRAVVFCTEDLQLVKGPARGRRRFLDLLLSQTETGYLATLLRYTKALRSRNALLKQSGPDELLLESFTGELVATANLLIAARHQLLPRIAPLVSASYQRVAGGRDEVEVVYQPAVRGDFAVELSKARARERVMRTTLVGPHRDEVLLRLNGQSALAFGSEGQKRTYAIALKMAQAEHIGAVHGVMPVLLIDDVMGELDAGRRAGLIPLLQRAHRSGGQVFMTCTEENWPVELASELFRWTVEDGVLKRATG